MVLAKKKTTQAALTIITSFFFLCGFSATLNDILIPFLQDQMQLSYTKIMLIQLNYYMAYFAISPLASKVISRIGTKRGVITGLSLGSVGCGLVALGAELGEFWIFLAAIFTLGTGVSTLQVAGNPAVVSFGDPEKGSSRLTFVQGFTSVGMLLAPFFGSFYILSGASASSSTLQVQFPYLVIGGFWLLLAILTFFQEFPREEKQANTRSSNEVWKNPSVLFATFAIFMYVGAEVCVGSFLIKFLERSDVANLPVKVAAQYMGVYWGGIMLGRFIGARILQDFEATSVLKVHALAAGTLVFIAMQSTGALATWSILLVGLLNSVMFPTIFSLGVQQLKTGKSEAAGIICMGNLGGAILPMLQGMLADSVGLRPSFLVPFFAFGFILFYAVRVSAKPVELESATSEMLRY